MSVAVYFEQQAFTSDDRYVVFASKRTAKWQIYRADLTTGEDTFLCWPNSSIKGKYGQFAHVHPSLSLSGRFACYTSTVSGIPQVYVVPIGKYTDSLNDKVKPEVLFIESD